MAVPVLVLVTEGLGVLLALMELLGVWLLVMDAEGVMDDDCEMEPVAVAVGMRTGEKAMPLNMYMLDVTDSVVQAVAPVVRSEVKRYRVDPAVASHVVMYMAYTPVSLRHVMELMFLPLGVAKPPASRHMNVTYE